MRGFACLIAFISAMQIPIAYAAADEGRKAAEVMIDRLGGAEAWAQARGARILEVHISKYARLPYTHEVWIDFTAPRILIRIKNQDLRQMRAMNLNEGWWIQQGEMEAYSDKFQADEHKRWRASPYRVLNLAARDDPRLSYQMVDADVLEIAIDSAPVLQFEIGENGEPIGFRRYSNNFESLIVLGELESYGKVKLWKEARTPDAGDFRSLNLEFELFGQPPPISFDPPEDLNDLTR